MKNLLLIPTMLLAACATTSGGGKGTSAPFQGAAALEKRRAEMDDAAKGAMECMKTKPGEQPSKGGVFAVVADAGGKLKLDTIKWDGPDAMKQCILDTGAKTTVSPLPGPSVGSLWEFLPPGEKPQPPKTPDDLAVKMQPLQETMQNQVVECGRRYLGVDFGATIEVSYFLFTNGKAYAPTVIKSDAKDGGFEACVQDVISTTKFPALTVEKPFGATAHFKIGQYGDTQHG
ncbi:MAG TPA: hypothetical protein VHB97_16885 [Polyangia bacterium]|jgi:hypothetical protein|nr:hypothetical protein [Polyangia bacterium]